MPQGQHHISRLGCPAPSVPLSPSPLQQHPPHAGLRRSRCPPARPTGAVHCQQGVAGVAEVERGGGDEQQQQGLERGEGLGGRERHCCWSESLVEEVGQGEDSWSGKGGERATADHAGR